MSDGEKDASWFAQRDPDTWRHEARNILDSYAHPWDILAELAQNAVDAIELRQAQEVPPKPGTIQITIDSTTRTVMFRDDGIGITNENLDRVLRPHFSAKRDKTQRGEKGVGLTYIVLAGDHFEIITNAGSQTIRLTVDGSQRWLDGGDIPSKPVKTPILDKTNLTGSTYTQVTVGNVPSQSATNDELDIFSLNSEQLEHLLRTRTAIGWTGTLFGVELKARINVLLTVTASDGSKPARNIPFSYASPEERLPRNSILSFEQVKNHLSAGKEQKVYGKVIRYSNVYKTATGKDILAYCLLMPRQAYDKQSESLGLQGDLRIQGGIYVTTKHMPTGITLQAPKTFSSGYWPNMYIVFGYDNMTFDLGRKSITGGTVQMLTKQAVEVFNTLSGHIKYTVRDEVGAMDALTSDTQLRDELTVCEFEPEVVYNRTRSR